MKEVFRLGTPSLIVNRDVVPSWMVINWGGRLVSQAHRPRVVVEYCASETKEEVRAEYAACGRPLTDDIEDELLVRTVWRLRVMHESHRPPWALHRPRQPRS